MKSQRQQKSIHEVKLFGTFRENYYASKKESCKKETATTKKYYVGLATNISYAGTYSGLQEKIDKQIEDALNE